LVVLFHGTRFWSKHWDRSGNQFAHTSGGFDALLSELGEKLGFNNAWDVG